MERKIKEFDKKGSLIKCTEEEYGLSSKQFIKLEIAKSIIEARSKNGFDGSDITQTLETIFKWIWQ